MKNVIIFDQPYSQEKIKEAVGINLAAVLTGACDLCRYLPRCECDESFKFPKDAACMKGVQK